MEKKIKILVVDDNRTNVLLIRKILESEGMEVTQALEGEEAFRLLGESTFDLVLLDIMMPDIDGFEVLATIRKDYNSVPVIMVSACHEKRNIKMAFDKGAVEYIKKPFRKKELLAKVTDVLNGGRSTYRDYEVYGSEIKNQSWFEKYFSSALKSFRKRKSVLIADDSISDVMLLEHALEEKNYRVLSAFDGNSALETICGERPDLVLLDIVMPGKDGIEVLQSMKGNPDTKDIPVIMISVIHEHEYIQKTMSLGIEAYVTKPYKLTKLVEIVEDVFNETNTQKKIYNSLHIF
ncbi:MAG: response regulator [Bacteroidetes bacterium]|nr:response regulator [Bacteroidota bacterium]